MTGFLLLSLSSCDGKEVQRKTVKPMSKGLPNELLVVVDRQMWEGNVGDSLRTVVEAQMPGLMQVENTFRVVRIDPRMFKRPFVTMRNVLVVKENRQIEKARMGVAYNVEAAPQTMVCVEAPDERSLAGFLVKYRQEIIDAFVSSEIKLDIARLKKKYNRDVYKASAEEFGCGVCVPTELVSMKRRERFLWASSERLEKDLNYVCYVLPMYPSETFLSEKWSVLRDSVMQRNIPGSREDQWMTTTREEGAPLVQCREVALDNGRTVYEMRGLWEMRHGAMGGPFVSLAYPDSANHRILVAEGFVYSPGTEKRDLIRRMEAVLRTLRFL